MHLSRPGMLYRPFIKSMSFIREVCVLGGSLLSTLQIFVMVTGWAVFLKQSSLLCEAFGLIGLSKDTLDLTPLGVLNGIGYLVSAGTRLIRFRNFPGLSHFRSSFVNVSNEDPRLGALYIRDVVLGGRALSTEPFLIVDVMSTVVLARKMTVDI